MKSAHIVRTDILTGSSRPREQFVHNHVLRRNVACLYLVVTTFLMFFVGFSVTTYSPCSSQQSNSSEQLTFLCIIRNMSRRRRPWKLAGGTTAQLITVLGLRSSTIPAQLVTGDYARLALENPILAGVLGSSSEGEHRRATAASSSEGAPSPSDGSAPDSATHRRQVDIESLREDKADSVVSFSAAGDEGALKSSSGGRFKSPGTPAREESAGLPRAARAELGGTDHAAAAATAPGITAPIDDRFSSAFTNALGMIFATEIGDKTFFIAAVMAMSQPRLAVFLGAIWALIVMTVGAVCRGDVVKFFPGTF